MEPSRDDGKKEEQITISKSSDYLGGIFLNSMENKYKPERDETDHI